MKISKIIAVAALLLSVGASYAADAPQKREMRSAWVATVWRLDWPQNVISSTGNTTQIEKQKADLVTMLDSLQANNMNAINFQIRGRSDAFYKSSFEPWSTDLVADRGMDPGYDPLAFCIEECHKRGMECHAWINPYRYESVAHQWDENGKPSYYRSEHPEWVMDVEGSNGTVASILNPGIPAVTQRICDIIAEVVTNYDVDGVLFDDYFYLSGTPMSADADLWNDYRAAGGTLSQADWRRDNVNRMVSSVYKTIKGIKPYVRFGISPAGIACTSTSVAHKYGITACPTGSDWQYSSIYSDPIAWVSSQSLDFISPQIYWTIGHSTDYDKACKWWSNVAAKFNRHFYSSHSISSLTASSKAPGESLAESAIAGEGNLAQPMASGPNSTTFSEYANEVRLNREYSQDGAPGSIFYSVKYMYRTAPLFAHSLRKSVFNTRALVPAMSWHATSNPGNPRNVTRAGANLSWQGPENVRYTVYAVPATVPEQNFNRDAEYLLGVSYMPSYTVPQQYLSGYNFAVCTLDRFGNEYSAQFVGAADKDMPATTLVAPAAGETVEMPFSFEWRPVDEATSYIVEVANDAAMTDLLYTVPVETTSAASDLFIDMPIEKPLYWRVRSCGNGYNDGISEVRTFTPRNLQIVAPVRGATGVSLQPVIEWTFGERDVTLQISEKEEFAADDIILQTDVRGGKYTVPRYTLAAGKQYFVRALYTRNGQDCVSPVTFFTTLTLVPEVPGIAHPTASGTFYSNESLRVRPTDGMYHLRLEVSASKNFPGRSSYICTKFDRTTWSDLKKGGEMMISSKPLVSGNTYYARVRCSYLTEDGEVNGSFCDPVEFVYSSESGVADITTNGAEPVKVNADGTVTVTADGHAVLRVYNATGACVAVPFDGTISGSRTVSLGELPAGIYIVTLNGSNSVKVVR